MGTEIYKKDELSITRYTGGNQGQMYQLTLGGWFIKRNRFELQELLKEAVWALGMEITE